MKKKKQYTAKSESAQSPEVGFLSLGSIGPDVLERDIKSLAREEGEEGVFIASDFLDGDIPSSQRNLDVPSEVSRLDSPLKVKENIEMPKKNRGQD
jgi:hypothetical protein